MDIGQQSGLHFGTQLFPRQASRSIINQHHALDDTQAHFCASMTLFRCKLRIMFAKHGFNPANNRRMDTIRNGRKLHFGKDVLKGFVGFAEALHPLHNPLNSVFQAGGLFNAPNERFLHIVQILIDQRIEYGFFIREELVQRANRHTCGPGNVVGADRLIALFRE